MRKWGNEENEGNEGNEENEGNEGNEEIKMIDVDRTQDKKENNSTLTVNFTVNLSL